MEDEEQQRAKRRLAVRITSPQDQHPRIMEYFRRNLGEPAHMVYMKNSVDVEVFGDTAWGRLLRLNNVEWRRAEKLRMQMIPARISLDSIVQYVSVELKRNSKNEAQSKDRHGNGNRERRAIRIIAKCMRIKPLRRIEVKVQNPRMERRRPAGST